MGPRPPLAAAIAICVVVVAAPLAVIPVSFDQVVIPRLGLTVVLTGVALGCLVSARGPLPGSTFGASALVGLFFLASTALSTAHGVDPRGSLLGEYQRYQGLLPLASYLLLFVVTAWAISTPSRATALAWSFVAGGTLAAGYGLLDRAGLDWIEWSAEPNPRAGGLFGQPNVLGLHLVVCMAVAIGLVRSQEGWQRRLVLGSLALMAVVLALTLSRGALVAASASVPFMVFALAPRPSKQAVLKVAVLALAVVGILAALPTSREVGQAGTQRLTRGVDYERLGLWTLAAEMWWDSPVVGNGPDSFPVMFPRYRDADQPVIGTANTRPESAHNFFLDLLCSQGILGILAFGSLICVVVYPSVRDHRYGTLDPLVASCLAGLLAYFTAVFFSFGEAMTGWIPWVLFGVLVGSRATWPQQVVPSSSLTVRAVGVAIRATGGVLAAVVMAAGGLLLTADLWAGHASRAGETDTAVKSAAMATRLDPLMSRYLLFVANVELEAGRADAAARDFHLVNERFAPTTFSLLAEATALLAADISSNRLRIEELLSQAEALDPHNDPARTAANALRGKLRGSPGDGARAAEE